MFFSYFKFELEAKGAIARIQLPPILSTWLDRSSGYCMYSPNQLRTYTTAHLNVGGWYLDCPASYTHPSEVQLRKSLEGIGTIDLDVHEFAGLSDAQRKRAIARRENIDRKKESRLQVLLETKEKKEAERLVKLAEKEKEKEREKEEKAKAKGKKKEDVAVVVPTSSTVDQSSQMVRAGHTGISRKSVMAEYCDDVVTQGTQVIALADDDEVRSKELVLNVSIIDIIDNEESAGPNCYTEVLDFLKKV